MRAAKAPKAPVGKRGWSSADAAQAEALATPPKPRASWSSRPLFDGAAEKARFEEAVGRGRQPGEDIVAFMERVKAEARVVGDRELPKSDRIPGEEG